MTYEHSEKPSICLQRLSVVPQEIITGHNDKGSTDLHLTTGSDETEETSDDQSSHLAIVIDIVFVPGNVSLRWQGLHSVQRG